VDYELIINSHKSDVEIALTNNKVLTELHYEKAKTDFQVGDIYLGKIKRVIPSLNAAFVNVGYQKDAFLHYSDLGKQYNSLKKYMKLVNSGALQSGDLSNFVLEPDINKHGKVKDVLSSGQQILVQIAKEPISSKGPRLTSELTLAGRYLVLVPFSNKVSMSQQIKNGQDRERLKRLMQSIKPPNFGIIVRTVAANKKVAELHSDLHNLMERWEALFVGFKNAHPPKRVLGELNKTTTVLRDLLNNQFSKIHVGSPEIFDEIKTYVEKISPDKIDIVKLYKGKQQIFDAFGINKQIKTSFGKKVSLPSGTYLIIEHTEAMHVIDVNSGNRKAQSKDHESNVLSINIEAAKEIARLLKLRDMGGLIVVDFIDMYDQASNRKLWESFKGFMAEDKTKSNVLMPSKFGIVEITRQRVRPEIDIKTAEVCPTCKGSGEVEASVLIVDEIENNLNYLIENQNEKSIMIEAHPFIASYLTKGLNSQQMQWFFRYKQWIKVVPNSSYTFLEYNFMNKVGEEILF
jgi:ribonuclease G